MLLPAPMSPCHLFPPAFPTVILSVYLISPVWATCLCLSYLS